MRRNLGYTSWNLPHVLDNDVEANSYTRAQLTGMIADAAADGCRYIRAPFQFSQIFRAPATITPGNLIDWWFYTCFQYKINPMLVLHGHPDPADTDWNVYVPSDGRFRHSNKPEPEYTSAQLDCYRELFDIIVYEANRAGVSTSAIPIQNGNELGKGGSGDWRPYTEQNPANPEEGSADGTVPASVVTFRSALLEVIREYDFIAVSPAMEAQTDTILTAELNSPGWLDVINAHDKVAVHSYAETSGDRNSILAGIDARTAFNTRKTTIATTFGITKPIWVTEVGRLQSECKPTGKSVLDMQATVCKRMGAEEAFPFVLCMNSNLYEASAKTNFNTTALTWPGR